jgi:hypothetical protein
VRIGGLSDLEKGISRCFVELTLTQRSPNCRFYTGEEGSVATEKSARRLSEDKAFGFMLS